jgi:hypothetical protein
MRLPLVSKLVRRYSQKRLSKLLAINSEEMDSLQLENRLSKASNIGIKY